MLLDISGDGVWLTLKNKNIELWGVGSGQKSAGSVSHHPPLLKQWLTTHCSNIAKTLKKKKKEKKKPVATIWMIRHYGTGATVWEVQVSPEGQHWRCIGRFGYRPRGHQSTDIRAWTSYQQQSPMAGLIETLCKGQYHRALYHTLIIWGIPLWLSDSTPAGIMRGMLVIWRNSELFSAQQTDGQSSVQHFAPLIWSTVGYIVMPF